MLIFLLHVRTPHLPDPYEAIFVEVRQSRIKDAGQGLFAKTDIEQGTIISFYNGVKVGDDMMRHLIMCDLSR